jgi:hypothetical protein
MVELERRLERVYKQGLRKAEVCEKPEKRNCSPSH